MGVKGGEGRDVLGYHAGAVFVEASVARERIDDGTVYISSQSAERR